MFAIATVIPWGAGESMHKTYEQWEGDLGRYLEIGDTVDHGLYWHFVEILPPAFMSNRLIQLGEAVGHVNGRPTFLTLRRAIDAEVWTYCGACYRGSDTAP